MIFRYNDLKSNIDSITPPPLHPALHRHSTTTPPSPAEYERRAETTHRLVPDRNQSYHLPVFQVHSARQRQGGSQSGKRLPLQLMQYYLADPYSVVTLPLLYLTLPNDYAALSGSDECGVYRSLC